MGSGLGGNRVAVLIAICNLLAWWIVLAGHAHGRHPAKALARDQASPANIAEVLMVSRLEAARLMA